MNSKANGSGAHACNAMMRDALLHALQQEVAFDGRIMSKMHAIAGQVVAKALAGDMRAVKEIFDRMDGKARPAAVAREQPMEAQAGIGLQEQLRQLTAGYAAAGRCRIGWTIDAIGGYAATVRDRQRHCLLASDQRAACFACFARFARSVTDRRDETSACLVLRPGAGKPVGSGHLGRTQPTGKPPGHTEYSPRNCRAVRGGGEWPR